MGAVGSANAKTNDTKDTLQKYCDLTQKQIKNNDFSALDTLLDQGFELKDIWVICNPFAEELLIDFILRNNNKEWINYLLDRNISHEYFQENILKICRILDINLIKKLIEKNYIIDESCASLIVNKSNDLELVFLIIKHVGVTYKRIGAILANNDFLTETKILIICFCICQGYELTKLDFDNMFVTNCHTILQKLIAEENLKEYSQKLIESYTCAKCGNINTLNYQNICNKCKSKELIDKKFLS